MAYSHDNRIKYVVRYLYDIDNNGVLDKNDFKCLAVRNTIVETKGDFPAERFAANAKVMDDLWNEIAQLADFDKNGEVDVDEFKKAVHDNCLGKDYGSFPPAFKAFIENQFKIYHNVTVHIRPWHVPSKLFIMCAVIQEDVEESGRSAIASTNSFKNKFCCSHKAVTGAVS